MQFCTSCVCVCARGVRESHHSVVCVRERESHQHRVCVCAHMCKRGRRGHTTAACLQTHTSIITVSDSVPLRLELMVKLRTLLTVFTFILKPKACDYGKGHYISDSCLRCPANHNALCQLANQSRLCLSEGGTL